MTSELKTLQDIRDAYSANARRIDEAAREILKAKVVSAYPTATGYTIESNWDSDGANPFLAAVIVPDASDLVDEPELGEMEVWSENLSDPERFESLQEDDDTDEAVSWVFEFVSGRETLEKLTVRF